MLFLNEQGIETASYQKIKRIPFGEYIPIFEDLLSVEDHRRFTQMLEKAFATSFEFITPGDRFTHFNSDGLRIIPLICYETTDGPFVARAISEFFSTFIQEDEAPQAALMVALSNDAWFESPYLSQHHVTSSIMRAVENRIPLVHVSIMVPPWSLRHQGK